MIQIGRLVDRAKLHMSQALVTVNNRQSPAAAFWEYLVAYKLVAEVIPRHRDYIDRVETNRGALHRDYTQVRKVSYASRVRKRCA